MAWSRLLQREVVTTESDKFHIVWFCVLLHIFLVVAVESYYVKPRLSL